MDLGAGHGALGYRVALALEALGSTTRVVLADCFDLRSHSAVLAWPHGPRLVAAGRIVFAVFGDTGTPLVTTDGERVGECAVLVKLRRGLPWPRL